MKLPAVLTRTSRLDRNQHMAHVLIDGRMISFFLYNDEAITSSIDCAISNRGFCPVMVELNPADQFCKVLPND